MGSIGSERKIKTEKVLRRETESEEEHLGCDYWIFSRNLRGRTLLIVLKRECSETRKYLIYNTTEKEDFCF
ncbi:hypothetical protein RHMOL_Rhmol01G0375700 [Rhododendron molle]|uniref:Uncharacterized protein n=1 Tax=Rhododendron molle TaxID=49168 RepID=A0ACC0QBV5_RHOML|nr:hypothetical protein RHMOL_Rhmol01G0375700 [Rhododendron molle]